MTMNVKIYKPSKGATQSGRSDLNHWILEAEVISPRKPESLIGWTSSEDTLNQIILKFKTSEQAVDHAKKNGWEYTVLPEQIRKVRPRNYGDNFKYFPPEKKSAK